MDINIALRMRVVAAWLAIGLNLAGGTSAAVVWWYHGIYGFQVLLRHGGTWWEPIRANDARLPANIRLALGAAPLAQPGALSWRGAAPGFAIAELPAIAAGQEVDTILLARIDPARFRFEVQSDPSGAFGLDQWMSRLGAALVVNGSYYAKDGKPDTPLLSNGHLLGPSPYDAKAGAFVAGDDFTGIRDLSETNWVQAFRQAQNAMVSYPLLIADGAVRVAKPSRWLANRSFVGQDSKGAIIIGTTRSAYFSLDRLAAFLLASPLEPRIALNLDRGPVACQGISIGGVTRRSYGRWEIGTK